MSTEVERIKKLVSEDMLVDAIEIPTNHKKEKALVVDDLEEALARFDDDADYAHFVVRVKRSQAPLPKAAEEPQDPQFSIGSMVNETLELTERLGESRLSAQPSRNQGDDYDPHFLFENARLLEESGDYALARNIYQVLVRKGGMIAQGLAGMARTYEKEGANDRAVQCYQEAIAYSSELPFFQGLAAIQIRLGEDEEAARTIIHALGMPNLEASDRFDLHKSLGNCYTRMADYATAEHHYRKAYEINPNSDVLQVNVGGLALQKQDFDTALKHFQKAIELNPSNDKAVSGLGMVHLAKNDAKKAHDSFAASLKLNLNNLGAIYNLVKCAYDLMSFDEAARTLKDYIAANPVNTNILYSYAGILYHQGDYNAAASEAAKILSSTPSHAGAMELSELIRAKLVK